MDSVTLIHTRWPKDEFIYENGKNLDDVDNLSDDERGRLYRHKNTPLKAAPDRKRISGMWGTMMMVIGDPIHFAQFDRPVPQQALCGGNQIELTINNRKVYVATMGAIASTKLFTTVERYRTNDGYVDKWDVGFVRLVGREKPYGLRVERSNSAVKKLRPGHDGICIRVLGGETAPQRGILIHEAPTVGWVIGCIGPRPYGDRSAYPNTPGNPSDRAVREIIGELARRGGTGSLFVLRS